MARRARLDRSRDLHRARSRRRNRREAPPRGCTRRRAAIRLADTACREAGLREHTLHRRWPTCPAGSPRAVFRWATWSRHRRGTQAAREARTVTRIVRSWLYAEKQGIARAGADE